MLYSRWRPDTGGYDYYKSSERLGIGDDLPVPKLPPGTSIGVPSTAAGRHGAPRLRHVGSGAQPRGSIMPLSRAGLSGADLTFSTTSLALVLGVAAAGYWFGARA